MGKQTIFEEEAVEEKKQPTSSGMEQNLAGMLSYLVGFVTGIIFLLIEKENKFVRYHAIQSIGLSVALILIYTVLSFIPFIGWLIGLLLSPVTMILVVYVMWQAYQNKYFKLPIISQIAEEQINKES
ncbi:MAG TPA: DUF4870 domain-containing protein [Bacilli bacterium]|nr:DUF4870 domain-containing protein [Bacilli bacterium]